MCGPKEALEISWVLLAGRTVWIYTRVYFPGRLLERFDGAAYVIGKKAATLSQDSHFSALVSIDCCWWRCVAEYHLLELGKVAADAGGSGPYTPLLIRWRGAVDLFAGGRSRIYVATT